jgi:hypothetical protein
VWIQWDLLREKRVHPEDCYPVARGQRIEGIPVHLSFSREILANGKVTYVDMLKISSMVKGGDGFHKLIMHQGPQVVEDLQGREAEGLGSRGGKGNSRDHQFGFPNLSHGSLIDN